jgi:Tfp pilus assembly protein PilW
VEVVIAAAVGAALFLVLAQVIAGAAQGYERQAARAELFQNGRAAQDRITRELRAGGTPVIGPDEIRFPFDANGDDVLDSTMRFARVDGRILRQVNDGPEEVLAEGVASLSFEGTDLTVIRIGMADQDWEVDLRTAVRHAN